MNDDTYWHQVVASIEEALVEIDAELTNQNMPLRKRKVVALDYLKKHMFQVDDWSSFWVSEAYARIMAVVDNWYHVRYGSAFKGETNNFHSLVVIYNFPFPLHVPLTFSIPGEEKGTVWVGFPASVQKEENPLESPVWISQGPNIDGPDVDRDELLLQATKNASSIRSINFDLRTLKSDTDEASRDLAKSILVDLRNAAQNLCGREEGQLRNAGWDLCQTVEKVMKLYIRRNGDAPEQTHKLPDLAAHAENFGVEIDRETLNRIPSGKQAVNLRYAGIYPIQDGLTAYCSALEIITELAFSVQSRRQNRVQHS